MILLWIAVGGACGALARYGLSEAVTAAAGSRLPWGTLAANLLGCFALGLLMGLAERTGVDHRVLQGVGVGFLGSFTTFSTFALESWRHLDRGEWWYGMANLGLHVVVGLTLVVAGMAASRWLTDGAPAS